MPDRIRRTEVVSLTNAKASRSEVATTQRRRAAAAAAATDPQTSSAS